MNHIIKIELIEPHVIRRNIIIEQERQIAIADLLHHNHFVLQGGIAPYELQLSLIDSKLKMLVSGENLLNNQIINLPLQQFRTIIKDYFMICESYFSALSAKDPYKLEAIDMSRRGVHNEGAEIFKNEISRNAEIDFDTARRLFTLMCTMQIR